MIQAFQKSLGASAARRRLTQSVFSANHQTRCIGWAEYVEQTWDAKEKKWKYEDPEDSVSRIREEVDSTGRSLTIHPRNAVTARHIKPTTAKKEKTNRIRYERKRKQVMDLVHYIQFVKDHRTKDNW